MDRPDEGNFFTAVPPVSNQDHDRTSSPASWRMVAERHLTNELRGGGNLRPRRSTSREPRRRFCSRERCMTNPVNTFLPQGRTTNTYNLQDNASWVHGKHTRRLRLPDATGARGRVQLCAASSRHTTLGVYSANDPYGYGVGDIPGASATDVNTANALAWNIAARRVCTSNTLSATRAITSPARLRDSSRARRRNRTCRSTITRLYVSDSWKVTSPAHGDPRRSLGLFPAGRRNAQPAHPAAS